MKIPVASSKSAKIYLCIWYLWYYDKKEQKSTFRHHVSLLLTLHLPTLLLCSTDGIMEQSVSSKWKKENHTNNSSHMDFVPFTLLTYEMIIFFGIFYISYIWNDDFRLSQTKNIIFLVPRLIFINILVGKESHVAYAS